MTRLMIGLLGLMTVLTALAAGAETLTPTVAGFAAEASDPSNIAAAQQQVAAWGAAASRGPGAE